MNCPSNQRFDDGAWKERILAPRKKQRYEQFIFMRMSWDWYALFHVEGFLTEILKRKNLGSGSNSIGGKGICGQVNQIHLMSTFWGFSIEYGYIHSCKVQLIEALVLSPKVLWWEWGKEKITGEQTLLEAKVGFFSRKFHLETQKMIKVSWWEWGKEKKQTPLEAKVHL